jgi:hypothetical protein
VFWLLQHFQDSLDETTWQLLQVRLAWGPFLATGGLQEHGARVLSWSFLQELEGVQHHSYPLTPWQMLLVAMLFC